MNDCRSYIANSTILALKDCKVVIHKDKIPHLSVNAMMELIKLIEEESKIVAFNLATKGKVIALPSIGTIKIKDNRIRYEQAYKDLLEKFNVKHEDDLGILERKQFDEELEGLKMYIVKNSKRKLEEQAKSNAVDNLLKYNKDFLK